MAGRVYERVQFYEKRADKVLLGNFFLIYHTEHGCLLQTDPYGAWSHRRTNAGGILEPNQQDEWLRVTKLEPGGLVGSMAGLHSFSRY